MQIFVMDHIKVSVKGNDRIADVVMKNNAAISAKVLAVEILAELTFFQY